MKLKIIMMLSLIFIMFSCYSGYTGAEGESLKKYLKPESLKTLIEKGDENIWIIDVRPTSSYNNGHIPTAKSFSSSEIMNRLEELPKEKYLIIYCETGGRAQRVIKKLEKKGYTRFINWGGYTRWKWELEK